MPEEFFQKALHSFKGLLILVEKASFSKEFLSEFHRGRGGYWFYYSIWLGFSFPDDRICQGEMICIGGVSVSKQSCSRLGAARDSLVPGVHRSKKMQEYMGRKTLLA